MATVSELYNTVKIKGLSRVAAIRKIKEVTGKKNSRECDDIYNILSFHKDDVLRNANHNHIHILVSLIGHSEMTEYVAPELNRGFVPAVKNMPAMSMVDVDGALKAISTDLPSYRDMPLLQAICKAKNMTYTDEQETAEVERNINIPKCDVIDTTPRDQRNYVRHGKIAVIHVCDGEGNIERKYINLSTFKRYEEYKSRGPVCSACKKEGANHPCHNQACNTNLCSNCYYSWRVVSIDKACVACSSPLDKPTVSKPNDDDE